MALIEGEEGQSRNGQGLSDFVMPVDLPDNQGLANYESIANHRARSKIRVRPTQREIFRCERHDGSKWGCALHGL